MRIAKASSLLILLLALAHGVQAGERRHSGERESDSPPGRLPVVRGPTQAKAVITALPMQPRIEPKAELYFTPLAEPAPSKTRNKAVKNQCISASNIRAADVRDDSTIRLTLGRNRQVDMKLYQSCPGLTFDESFYYQPGPTMELCARQDSIMARSGSRCLIDAFVPVATPPKK